LIASHIPDWTCRASKRVKKQMSQAQLGEAIGVTFQQVQNYESSKNRISAAKLFVIARLLNVPLGSFLEGADDSLLLR
jgi:transcriptional regulator with XRE-family HTH domain